MIDDVNVFELADELRDKRERKKALEEQVKQLNAELDVLDARLAQAMIDQETQSFSRAGKLYYIKTITRASAKAGEAENLYKWLKEHGAADLVKETVNAQTLTGYVKELLDETEDLPAGLGDLVNVYEKQTVAMRKA